MLIPLKFKERAPIQIWQYLAINVGQQGYNKAQSKVWDQVRGPVWTQVRNQVAWQLHLVFRESL